MRKKEREKDRKAEQDKETKGVSEELCSGKL